MVLRFDKKLLRKILVEEQNYSVIDADMMLEMFKKVDERLQSLLDQWMKYRTIADYEVQGVSIGLIMKKSKSDFCNALLDMNMFLKEPEEARKYLKRRMFFFD